MGKIKINLTSGNVIEKPLVTCFQGSNGSYIVFDNETNGPMGLPVICISKFSNNIASKITDPNEWAAVKENLKTIISGTAIPYLSVPESINANDDFYTQLSLPVASFDTLKNVYAPVAPVAAPVQETPAAPTIQSQPVAPAPAVAPQIVIPEATVVAPVAPAAPVQSTPVEPIATAPVIPTIPAMPDMAPETPTIPTIQPADLTTPSVSETSVTVAPIASNSEANTDINAIKENFMKSCENMFDALTKQFNIK